MTIIFTMNTIVIYFCILETFPSISSRLFDQWHEPGEGQVGIFDKLILADKEEEVMVINS